MQKMADKWLRAILAGFMIGAGGTLFLSVENRYMGSFLFGIGLFTILVFKLSLFTGKVGYAVQQKPAYLVDLAIIWAGNLIGTVGVGLMMLQTRSAAALTEKAAAICNTKLDDGLVSIFVLSIFCGVMMFLAADNFKKAENAMQKNIGIFLPVMVFILCGFEHCVANMFYFTVAQAWSEKAVVYLLVMSLGNSVGAFIFPLCEKVFQKAAQ
jgi:formate/nitrite transporter FocA (FNT family)